MDQLLKFITPVLIKLDEPNKNHSIALKIFYKKSFNSNTIGANHRPEIHENHHCTDRWRALHCSFSHANQRKHTNSNHNSNFNQQISSSILRAMNTSPKESSRSSYTPELRCTPLPAVNEPVELFVDSFPFT